MDIVGTMPPIARVRDDGSLEVGDNPGGVPFIGTLLKQERDIVLAQEARSPKRWR